MRYKENCSSGKNKIIQSLCSTKDKEKTVKKLAKHATESLALKSFEIVDSIPPSFRGYRYLGKMIENLSRKTWTLFLRDRKEILSALNQ